MEKHYSDEKNIQILLALLKAHGIRKIIASPGATNHAVVFSMQSDPYFEMYSSVDERSAAYMACGLAAESGEPVVLTCTGATASRNYLPGLTEAYYRKLPILAVTSTQVTAKIGHLVPQVIDNSIMMNDCAKLSVTIPNIKDDTDLWECEIKINKAILELKHHGGGPVHINLSTIYSNYFPVRELPKCHVINRIKINDVFPELPQGKKIGIFIGSHPQFSNLQTKILDKFCETNNAVVFCDHTSSYKGKYRLLYSIVSGQMIFEREENMLDVLIHIGEVSGDYYSSLIRGNQVWRISEDGEIKDSYHNLKYIFEMPEYKFFEYYAKDDRKINNLYFQECRNQINELRNKIPELPFSNIWIASRISSQIPKDSVIHFAILNTLRSWNFFELPESVISTSNVGGFGIDGCLSSLIGASLFNKNKLYFCIIGDLAFFYDINSIGNRHIGNNIRILLVNNGKASEFKLYDHIVSKLEFDSDKYVAASEHFGNKSRVLVRHYAEDLGFEYLSAENKTEFEKVYNKFISPEITDRPILLEVFTNDFEESAALEKMLNIEKSVKGEAKKIIGKVIGERGVKMLRKII